MSKCDTCGRIITTEWYSNCICVYCINKERNKKGASKVTSF